MSTRRRPRGTAGGHRDHLPPGLLDALTDRPYTRLGDAVTRRLTGRIPDLVGADLVHVRLAVIVVLAFGLFNAGRIPSLPDRTDVDNPVEFEQAVRTELLIWVGLAVLVLCVLVTWWACGAVARRVGDPRAIRAHRPARRWLRRVGIVGALAPVAWTPFLLAAAPDDTPRSGVAGLAWEAGGWLALCWFLAFWTPVFLGIRAALGAGTDRLLDYAESEGDHSDGDHDERCDREEQPAAPRRRARIARVTLWVTMPLVLLGLPGYVVVAAVNRPSAGEDRLLPADVALVLLAPVVVGYVIWAVVGGLLAALARRDAGDSR